MQIKQFYFKYFFYVTALFLFLINCCFADKNDVSNIRNGFNPARNLSNLNSLADDFAPIFNVFEGKLYFNSNRSGYSKFYTAKLDENLADATLLKTKLNENSQNKSYIAFLDEKTALLSAFVHTKKASFLNIHKSIIERNTWSNALLIDELSDASFNAHPTVSPSSKMLIFSSNRQNKTDTDLWISFMQEDGFWGMLMQIDELNSTGNEITPHLVSDSLLIFASNGFDGPGGYDLYYSVLSNNVWTKPIPINDINTEFNESDATILPDGAFIFASDRIGGEGGLDLYLATCKQLEKKPEAETLVLTAPVSTIEITKNISYNLAAEELAHYRADTIFYDILPPAVQISLAWSDKFAAKEAFCIINNDTLKIDIQNKNIIYNLENLDRLFAREKINALVIVTDSLGEQIQDNFEFEVVSNEIKKLRQHKTNNKKYYQIFTNYYESIDKYLAGNNEVLEKVSSLLSAAKSITLYSSAELSNIFLQKLQSTLKTKIRLKSTTNNTLTKVIEIRIEIE